ncbi:conserved exported hypothetical protein [Rubrivivax sp. A210]|uniref:hypothetical protein n=1 Tax=Rubrivivax sp. A210 TaxID=2772301 RepID=UPI001918FD0C|nr:hypothetical protein [Rubrivivax sp. A210]CAD5366284.1 conserved exported hypothetical protein [Rubrivivax sp. A210]
MNLKTMASVALVLAAATGAAQARPDVQWSLTIGAPLLLIHGQSAPVHVQPAPVYVQPAPVYVEPAPVYVRPAPVYMRPAPVYVQAPPVYVRPPRWDRDGDGIPDRRERFVDRQDGWRWDRDGDGVPNRHDRHPGDPWRR